MGNRHSCCLLSMGEIKHIYIAMWTVQRRASSQMQENVKLAGEGTGVHRSSEGAAFGHRHSGPFTGPDGI